MPSLTVIITWWCNQHACIRRRGVEIRDGVISVVRRLRDEAGIDGIILGGTELTLLLSAPMVADIPALDTTSLHVDAIVERLWVK